MDVLTENDQSSEAPTEQDSTANLKGAALDAPTESEISLVNGENESDVTQNHNEEVVKENGQATPMEVDTVQDEQVESAQHKEMVQGVDLVDDVDNVEHTEKLEDVNKNKEADFSNEKLAEDERIDLTIENNEKFEIINKDEEVDDSNEKPVDSTDASESKNTELSNDDLLTVTHTETEEDDPLDKCESADTGEHNYSQKQGIIKDHSVHGPSVLKQTLISAPVKSQKYKRDEASEAIHTISDNSDSDSDSSTLQYENTSLEHIRDSILKLLAKQQPKVLSEEDKQIRKQSNAGPKIQYTRIHCTACNKHLGSALDKQKDRYVHPLLKVLVCKSCHNFYMSGDFEKDEDGSELYCRWCGQGGKVICCSKCEFVFCSNCIKRNFGWKRLQHIKNSDDWLCFCCDQTQLLQLQINCTALFEYCNEEIQLLTVSNDPNGYKTDYSNCCSNRKRKLSWSKDAEFDIQEELIRTKKAKTTKNRHSNTAKAILNTQEQEEVVCAPDLLSFIEDDEQPEVQEDVTIEKPAPPSPIVPILPAAATSTPIRFIAPVVFPKNAVFVQNPVSNTVLLQNQPKPSPQKSVLVHNPASMVKVRGKQIVLNTSLNNPITPQNIGNLTSSVEKVSTHKITLRTPNQNLPKLVPGLKYEWFDTALKSSNDIQSKLIQSVATLNTEKDKASTMDDLARIHNKFQEVLSKCINAMIQIRRTLRNDFLSSLNQLKFIKKTQEPKDEEDDDVVFVDSTGPPSLPQQREFEKPHGPYLKVRSVSQLLNVPSECITIPDDVIEKITENRKEEDARKLEAEQQKANENNCDISNDSNKENLENFVTLDEQTQETVTELAVRNETETIEITPDIQKAIFESRIEKLVNDNLKYNVVGVTARELKRMLSARVYVSKNYQPKKKRTIVPDGSCEDFEALLDRSVVLKNND